MSQTSLSYVFPNSQAVAGTLNVAAGVKVLVDSAYDATRTLTVNGTMNLAAGSFLTLDASQNYSTTQVIVNGALNASGVAFAPSVANNSTSTALIVNNGGHLHATNSTFAYSYLSLGATAVFTPGDLANDAFNLPIYVPSADVALLSAAGGGADNQQFQAINVTSDVAAGATVNFNPIGTVSQTSLSYVFPNSQAVAGTLNVAAGVKVLVDSAYDATRTLTVNGTMNLAAGSFLTLDASQNYSTTQVIVNGALNASGVAFAPSVANNSTSTALIVNNGGHLHATNSTFAYSYLSLGATAVFTPGDLANDAFNLPIYVPSADVALLSAAGGGADNQQFQAINVTSDVAAGATVNFNPIGTVSQTSLSYVFPNSQAVAGTLNVAAGVKVLVDSAYDATRTLTVNGTMNLAAGSFLTLDASQNYSTTRSSSTGRSTPAASPSPSVANNSTSTALIVNNGGHLHATNSTFAYSYLSLGATAVFTPGDLANDAFNLPIYVPSADVALLSAAGGGADNQQFQAINVTSDVAAGATVNFNPIGTVSQTSLSYVFPNSQAVAGTLNVAAGVKVLVDSAYDATRTLTVNGTMNLAAGSFLTLDASQNYSTTQVIVNGALNASGVAFAQRCEQQHQHRPDRQQRRPPPRDE